MNDNETSNVPAIEFNMGNNDILVVEVPGSITREQAEGIRQGVGEQLKQPGLQVIVVSDGISIKVIHRPENAQ